MTKEVECGECGHKYNTELTFEGDALISIFPFNCPKCGSNKWKMLVDTTNWFGTYGTGE